MIEKYKRICKYTNTQIFNTDLHMCLQYIQPAWNPQKGGHQRRPHPFVEAAGGRLHYIWARQAEYIANTYANMY